MATKSATPNLDALLGQEPDLVDRIFAYLLVEFPQLAGGGLAEAKRAVREEFGAREAYVARRGAAERQEVVRQVLEKFNGRNASEVARELQISRATVYRLLKQPGRSKSVSPSPRNETAQPVGSRNGKPT